MKRGFTRLALIIYLLLGWGIIFSQTIRIDSLFKVIESQELSEAKVDNILNISYDYHRIDINKCLEYATLGLELADQLNYIKGQSSAFRLLALSDYYKGNFERALDYGTKSLDLAQTIQDRMLIIKSANTISVIYNLKARNDKSIEYLMFAYNAAKELNDSLSMINVLQNLGYLHSEEGNIEESKKYYEVISSFNIHEGSNSIFRVQFYHGSAIHNRNQRQYDKAIRLFSEGILIAEESNNLFGLAALHEGVGITYNQIQSSKRAEYHFKEAMKNYELIGAEEQYLYIVSKLTSLYNKNGQYEKAITLGSQGIVLADKLNTIHDQSILSLELAIAYEQSGQIPLALKYQKDHKIWSDSLSSTTKDEIILKMESEYQVDLLNEQQLKNEAIIKEQKLRNFISALLLLIASIIALFYWMNFRANEKYSKRLEQEVAERTMDLKQSNHDLSVANSELERFAFISAHDLKEHTRNIGSFTNLLQREYENRDETNEKSYTYFSVLDGSIKSMSQLVEDVLQYIAIKKDNMDQDVDLNKIVNTLRERLDSNSEEYKGAITSHNLPTIKGNNQQISLLFKELIENGFKFNESQNPEINISYTGHNNMHQIELVDNGIGIDEIYTKQAFKMFTRLHNRSEYQGSGLGLAIVNKIINLIDGEVSIHNREEGGTTVTLFIPKDERKVA